MKNKTPITKQEKELLDERLKSLRSTTKRTTWSKIEKNAQSKGSPQEKEDLAFGKLIKEAVKEADGGNVKKWSVVKKKLLNRIKNGNR